MPILSKDHQNSELLDYSMIQQFRHLEELFFCMITVSNERIDTSRLLYY